MFILQIKRRTLRSSIFSIIKTFYPQKSVRSVNPQSHKKYFYYLNLLASSKSTISSFSPVWQMISSRNVTIQVRSSRNTQSHLNVLLIFIYWNLMTSLKFWQLDPIIWSVGGQLILMNHKLLQVILQLSISFSKRKKSSKMRRMY